MRQEAAADLGSPRRSRPSGKSRPLITEIIPHLRLDSFSSSASTAAAAAAVFSPHARVYASSMRASVPAAAVALSVAVC